MSEGNLTAMDRINARVAEVKASKVGTPEIGKSKEDLKNSFLEIAKARVKAKQQMTPGAEETESTADVLLHESTPDMTGNPASAADPLGALFEQQYSDPDLDLYEVFGLVDIGQKGTAPRKFLAKKVEEMLPEYPHLTTLVDALKASKQTIMKQTLYNQIVDSWLEQCQMQLSPQQISDDNETVAAKHEETEAELAGHTTTTTTMHTTYSTQSLNPPVQAAAVEPVLDDILFVPARQTLTQHLSQQKPLVVDRDKGRLAKLADLFAAFDINGDGFIQKSELKAVGDARTAQGHSSRHWTDAKNDGLIKEIDANQDGVISKEEFLDEFYEKLPFDPQQFIRSCAEMLVAAQSLHEPVPSQASRRQQLQSLFQEMDLDNSGNIDAAELGEVAQMRRALHQKCGDKPWTAALNNRLMEVIDSDEDGQINKFEFIDHYLRLFEAQDDYHFNTWVEQFQQVVQELHKRSAAVSSPDLLSPSEVFEEFIQLKSEDGTPRSSMTGEGDQLWGDLDDKAGSGDGTPSQTRVEPNWPEGNQPGSPGNKVPEIGIPMSPSVEVAVESPSIGVPAAAVDPLGALFEAQYAEDEDEPEASVLPAAASVTVVYEAPNPGSRLVVDLEAAAVQLLPMLPKHFHKQLVQWAFEAPGRAALVQAISAHDDSLRRVASQFRHALYIKTDSSDVEIVRMCEVALDALQSGEQPPSATSLVPSKVRWEERGACAGAGGVRGVARRRSQQTGRAGIRPQQARAMAAAASSSRSTNKNLVLRRIFLRHAKSITGRNCTFDKIRESSEKINLTGMMHFLSEFGLSPGMVRVEQVRSEYFTAGGVGVGRGAGLDFKQFLVCAKEALLLAIRTHQSSVTHDGVAILSNLLGVTSEEMMAAIDQESELGDEDYKAADIDLEEGEILHDIDPSVASELHFNQDKLVAMKAQLKGVYNEKLARRQARSQSNRSQNSSRSRSHSPKLAPQAGDKWVTDDPHMDETDPLSAPAFHKAVAKHGEVRSHHLPLNERPWHFGIANTYKDVQLSNMGGVADQIKAAPAPQAAIPVPAYQAVHPPPVPIGHTVGLKELQQRVEGTLHTLDHQRHAPRQPPPQQHGYRGQGLVVPPPWAREELPIHITYHQQTVPTAERIYHKR